ncbi:phosphoglycerol transferase [Desulfocicer vacuolatum DSM 3385]|uniref:Phosphoglycerol transferase n=1 Tax=Desulfocicer vacuolatum DSM 3385 TaxID=1121400 RepID=A0A1W2A5X4_9BACT|nr:sulfatase-like hydrolase/transferase [Desulfocicer vacuolatum]SMC55678.1 phosphoglycerol transferase [Desulfocicer vacuolatum DSM 3385]
MDYILASIVFFLIAIYFSIHHGQSRKKRLFFSIVIFAYLFSLDIFWVADYFTGEGINDAVIYHIFYGLGGAGFKEFYKITFVGIVFFLFGVVASFFYYKTRKADYKIPPYNIGRAIMCALFFCIAFMLNPTPRSLFAHLNYFDFPFKSSGSAKYIGDEKMAALQEDFNRYYLLPKSEAKTKTHPNLIYIYAESLELTYFDEKLFPGLVPNLKQIQKENISFSNINQIIADDFTVGGMITSQCGIPLFTPSGGNSMNGMERFYEGAVCLGDFLASQKYTLVYRGGASLKFAGKGKLYTTHGFIDVKGREELLPHLEDKNNVSPWGLYDDTLFDIIYEDFMALSESKTRFAIFTLTLDTHGPDGYLNKSCRDIKYLDGSNEMLNAVACTDYIISRFIRKIQASKFGKDTVVVLSSDHLAMKNGATAILKKGDRKNLFMIIDPRNETARVIDKKGSLADVAATILSSLGYDTALGLGRNLQSHLNSLSVEFENYKKKLVGWRPVIEKFWNNPKIGTHVFINNTAKTITINSTTYKYPLLLEINKNREVRPYFEFNDFKKLTSFLVNFNPTTPFIWIDECRKISYLDTAIKDKKGYCLAMGQLGSDIVVKSIDKTMLVNTKVLDSKKNDAEVRDIFTSRMKLLRNYVYKKRYKDAWSKGKTGEIEIESVQDEKFEIRYLTNNPKKQLYRFEILIDGENFESSMIEPFKWYQKKISIPKGQHKISLHIEDTFNPYKLNTSKDNRDLGINFKINKLYL